MSNTSSRGHSTPRQFVQRYIYAVFSDSLLVKGAVCVDYKLSNGSTKRGCFTIDANCLYDDALQLAKKYLNEVVREDQSARFAALQAQRNVRRESPALIAAREQIDNAIRRNGYVAVDDYYGARVSVMPIMLL